MIKKFLKNKKKKFFLNFSIFFVSKSFIPNQNLNKNNDQHAYYNQQQASTTTTTTVNSKMCSSSASSSTRSNYMHHHSQYGMPPQQQPTSQYPHYNQEFSFDRSQTNSPNISSITQPNANKLDTSASSTASNSNLAMSPMSKSNTSTSQTTFMSNNSNKKLSSSSLLPATNIDLLNMNAPTPSSSFTSSVMSPRQNVSPKSWNTPVQTPMSVSQTTPPRMHSSQSSSSLLVSSLDLSQEIDFVPSNQSQKSILSEINIDELFMYFPSVFEELFYSFKLNSIEQIENELRSYLEQQFKLNLSNGSNSNVPVSNAGVTSASSGVTNASPGIRI